MLIHQHIGDLISILKVVYLLKVINNPVNIISVLKSLISNGKPAFNGRSVS